MPPRPPDADVDAAPPAEPEFDEVWFPGGRRHDHQHENRREHARPPRRRDANAPVTGAPPAGEGTVVPAGCGGRAPRATIIAVRKPTSSSGQTARPRLDLPAPAMATGARTATTAVPTIVTAGARTARDPREDRKPFDKKKPFGKSEPRPPREPAYDPDSPFAALAALRNLKPE